MTSAGDHALFVAYTEDLGMELWRTEGTEETTLLIEDIREGPQSSEPRDLTALGDIVVFRVSLPGSGGMLWRSDGTDEGTFTLNEPSGTDPLNLERVGEHVYFSGANPKSELPLWRTDGTEAGTELLVDLCDGVASGGQFGQFTASDDRLSFGSTSNATTRSWGTSSLSVTGRLRALGWSRTSIRDRETASPGH